MKLFLPLWQRETAAYFRTPVAAVGGAFFLLIVGSAFALLASRSSGGVIDAGIVPAFFSSLWFWLALLAVTPLLTMRLFAEEIRLGTLDSLLSAPVKEHEIVLSKFAAALAVFVLFWTPLLLYPLVARLCGASLPLPDSGSLLASALGTLLIGSFFLSAGLFCSLLSRHQVIAAMMSLAFLGLCASAGPITDRFRFFAFSPVSHYFSPPRHMRDFAAGILDSRSIVLYLSATMLFLFLSIRVLESKRLR